MLRVELTDIGGLCLLMIETKSFSGVMVGKNQLVFLIGNDD